MITTDDFTRINNDINGNPRYVCHFCHLAKTDWGKGINERYAEALQIAKKIGGKKFHNKQYGGGIVFQSYNLQDECNSINKLMND